jgi:hypothetical protein
LEGIKFTIVSDLIAIGKKIQEENQICFKKADLAASFQRSHIYTCKRHQFLSSDLEGSCLEALFTQNPRYEREL